MSSFEDFWPRRSGSLLLDVRAPAEFQQGHIPQAVSLPLFSDEERARVGTLYKQRGRQRAFELGLELVGPKLAQLVRRVAELNPQERPLALYCARGGARSASVGWLLQTAGYQVEVLGGGYKSYRKMVLDSFAERQEMLLLSGYTGSGKTRLLQALRRTGEQVLDIEGLAGHLGSAFGGRSQPATLTNEHFWNLLYEGWSELERGQRVWVEDEARNLGRVEIPPALFEQMRQRPVVFLEIPQEARLKVLLEDYGHFDDDFLQQGIECIAKRLGGENALRCRQALQRGERREVARICLSYYDRAYLHGLSRRTSASVTKVSRPDTDTEGNLQALLRMAQASSASRQKNDSSSSTASAR